MPSVHAARAGSLALDSLRREKRRRRREAEAVQLTEQNAGPAEAPALETPLLDEGLRRLSAVELNALMLRYFQGKSFEETGAALKLSEEAARKRVNRALEKLRHYFARRGIAASAAV